MKTKIFPKLFALSSDGRQKEWQVSVHEQEDGICLTGSTCMSGSTCLIRRSHGFTGHKIQTTDKPVKSGKNLGKKNETTIFEQACFDAQSLYNKKSDRAYTETVPTKEQEDPAPLPMLALAFKKRKHNIKYPCFVQPKLNGVRCFARKVDETTIAYTSRNGKVYDTLDHLTPHLLPKMEIGDIVDGEIYVHGMNFQQIVRLVKKFRPQSKNLNYYVYDKADADLPYRLRKEWIRDHLGDISGKTPIWCVDTYMATDEDVIYESHKLFVQDGYEGVIIRNSEGKYKFRHRSKDLQKYKEFFDEEFVIVGGRAATGIHQGCMIFKVEVDEKGETFDVYPKGTLEQRRQMFKNLDSYTGKKLTVRYQEKSEDGVPIFPVGIVIRDYE